MQQDPQATDLARQPLVIVDGHVHITNRVYFEGIDPWQPQPFGFDYARATVSGVNVVIENVAPYGAGNYNYTPKQALRLVETFHRALEQHPSRMGLALSAADARRITGDGRLAVFLGIESGFDHEGDPDVLRALYRLGLRVVQFSTQTCFNAFADTEIGGPATWNGINDRGRELVSLMNQLGILIDITHATEQAQQQIIEASTMPVVASHTALQAVSGTGMSDATLRAVAAKGGMIGIIGAAGSISPAYRQWLAAHPQRAAELTAPVLGMVSFHSPLSRAALDHGEFGAWLDTQLRAHHLAAFTPRPADTGTAEPTATAAEWAAQVSHVIELVGPDHAGIGLDLVGGRSCVPRDASGYPELIAALRRVTSGDNVAKVAGGNWLRVLDTVLGP